MITKSYVYSVWFAEGSADIAGIVQSGVDQGLGRWPSMPDHRVRIVGCADAEKEDERLALARAEAIFRYLVDRGIDDARIDALTACSNAAAKSQVPSQVNRRVTIEFYNRFCRTPNRIP